MTQQLCAQKYVEQIHGFGAATENDRFRRETADRVLAPADMVRYNLLSADGFGIDEVWTAEIPAGARS
ncbi:hypothetical protein ACTJI8_09685 [Microbacterium sp. 22303]|uniref:hypothetical protein n=1 Tax=Microbacterium sp. 22303 TaxID=3453905 RepID=UPI003F8620E1